MNNFFIYFSLMLLIMNLQILIFNKSSVLIIMLSIEMISLTSLYFFSHLLNMNNLSYLVIILMFFIFMESITGLIIISFNIKKNKNMKFMKIYL
uniref:NADH dehydrogenase subunit 4L n=1 Tax=Cephalonomia gallicola TaxID=627714 RepID=E0WCF0_9HYME|nr:NADH dehydrogenase subunit 4L [Cephalonomia gallicola]